MQKVKIPLSIAPAKAALKRMTYDGIIVKGELSRLSEVAELLDDHVNVSIECGIDSQNLVVIQGTATASLELTCQRCGNGLNQDVKSEFVYTPIRDAAEESEDPIPEAYEEIELNEFGEINLVHLVEDELMLALPIVAMHEPEECSLTDKDMTFGELAPEATEEEKPNPFDVLKKLKT
ncbi:23S rRNA accumulation protein YceD [Psychrosphaera ytuae]|uniref:Large ribosomal RNA subunit accumulation protein YceD n=1 Tax=Psychrosphaera ytuae TaxID=2820710 RepID=A0A975HI78_9GAMM|nr:23S rRNA accumulation protein YceD [Psychrosphaera ytuae]QTH63961.1 23S rRNA accumulation protein YceD [Psychrosphaera ytuae]